ncbi:MAG: aspartyl protease family protein [Candidatus Zixiibacteriota bacterium]
MYSIRIVVDLTMSLAILAVGTCAAQELSDPYVILDKSFDAAGGLDRLRSETSSSLEGSLSVAGMEGTIEAWSQKPGMNRTEIKLGPLNITQGHNGKYEWVLDQNGKLQLITNPDGPAVKRRKVKLLIDDRAYADRGSDIFTVSLEGTEHVEGRECYIVKIANNINSDSYTSYINTETFLEEKAVYIEDDQSRDTFYGDYREVDGLRIAFWVKEISHRTGQVQEITLTQYVSNPKIDPSLFEPPEQGSKDYRFTVGDRAENIPFKFISNHLFIPVTVGCKERLWVLDTGAGMTVLNKAFAKELGLGLEGEMKGQGAGGTVDASFATLPSFSIQGIEFDEQTAAVIDMDELIRRVGVDVVGILGFDFLSRFVTKVDYARGLVSFYEPETFEYSGDGHQLGIHLDNSVFKVQATLDGTHSGSWLLDLGAGTTHLDGCYALREGYAERAGVLGLGHGAGNEYQLKEVSCDSIQFAGYTIHDPEINFSFGGTDTVFSADQVGVLGNSLFRNFVLYCDYANERIIVEKGEDFNRPFPRNNSGLQVLLNDDDRIEVLYVSPGTPAEKAGLLKGDLFRSVNGIEAGLFDGVIAIRELLKADPGTEYDIVVDRSGESKRLKLMLAKLL